MRTIEHPLVVMSTRYFEFDPAKMPDAERDDARKLLEESVASDFPNINEDAVEQFARLSERQNADLNDYVGTSLRAGQSFRRPRLLIAVYGAKPVASLMTADNVHSSKPEPIAMAERAVKMNLLATKRWHWLGMRAVKPEMLPPTPDDKLNYVDVVDVLGYLSMFRKSARQPVASYPWKPESWWRDTLLTWGLHPKNDTVTDAYPFGSDYPVEQKRWTAASTDFVCRTILDKTGADKAIGHALAILKHA